MLVYYYIFYEQKYNIFNCSHKIIKCNLFKIINIIGINGLKIRVIVRKYLNFRLSCFKIVKNLYVIIKKQLK